MSVQRAITNGSLHSINGLLTLVDAAITQEGREGMERVKGEGGWKGRGRLDVPCQDVVVGTGRKDIN